MNTDNYTLKWIAGGSVGAESGTFELHLFHNGLIFVFIIAAVKMQLVPVLSINAAISVSVVLASRLPDDISVFALMLPERMQANRHDCLAPTAPLGDAT